MGNFEHMAIATKLPSGGRSVLSDAVGPGAPNAPADLSLIARALETAGLLDASAPSNDVRLQVFRAIQHVARTLGRTGGDSGPPDVPGHLAPASTTERVFRRAVASGRFPISHRAARQSPIKPGIHALVSGGTDLARKKLVATETQAMTSDTRYRRAVLPSMSKQAFLTNRRLVQALKDGGAIPGLEVVLAESLSQDGKQGFVNVRDFFQALNQKVPSLTSNLQQRVTAQLGSKAGRRFRKLCQGEPPVEAGFFDQRPKAET